MISKILLTYAVLMLTVLIHELGHRPKKIVFKKLFGIIPLPSAAAMQSRSRYGGLIANAICFLTIFFWNPHSETPMLLLGAFCWMHFVLYTLLGSFNYEQKVSKSRMKSFVFDDVPNKLKHIFVPLSIITFWLLKDFYIPVLTKFFGG